MTIADAPVGGAFTVVKVTIGKEIGKRLADMGFTHGAEGVVIRAGFFRGPLHVRVRGYDLLIRRGEAAGIEVEPQGDWSVEQSVSGRGRGFCRRSGMSAGGGRHRGFGRHHHDETDVARGVS